MPAMMFQPGNRERAGIRLAVNQKWFAPAKMSHTRTVNLFREMPAGADTVFHQFFFSMMPPDMLQIGHGALDFSTLGHCMDKVIEHSHFPPGEKAGYLFRPGLHFRPFLKWY